MTRSVAVFVLLLFFSSPIVAQVNSTNRANCDLSVRVVTSDQRRIETPVQVTLLSSQGVIATVQIVGDESAQFMVANAKTYRVTVSGLGLRRSPVRISKSIHSRRRTPKLFRSNPPRNRMKTLRHRPLRFP
jgi:hypothetical protein